MYLYDIYTMTTWMETYDAVFFISIGTMSVGLMALIIKFCIKSKCEHFSLCFGLITVDRRVDLEVQEEMHKIDKGIDDDKNDDIFLSQHTQEKRPSVKANNERV